MSAFSVTTGVEDWIDWMSKIRTGVEAVCITLCVLDVHTSGGRYQVAAHSPTLPTPPLNPPKTHQTNPAPPTPAQPHQTQTTKNRVAPYEKHSQRVKVKSAQAGERQGAESAIL